MPTITNLTELATAPGENDVVPVVNLAAPVGTRTKKTKWSTLKAALKVVTDAYYATIDHAHTSTYAPIAKGVTNGDSHDHLGGDGATINFLQAGTGAVTRTAQNKMRDLVSITDFGCVGNGSTDNTATLQLAVDSGATGLYVPRGQFNIDDLVTINSSVRFFGDGFGSSIFAATSATQNIFKVTTTLPVDFQDLCISSTTPKTAGIAIEYNPTGATQNNFSMINRVHFMFQFQAIDFVKCAYKSVQNCHFDNNSDNGTLIKVRNTTEPDAGDQSILNNAFYGGTGVTHVKYEGGGGLRVIGNKFLQGSSGIATGFASGVTSGILIINGNSFDGQTANAISLTNAAAGVSFTDMVIDANQFNGSPSVAFIYAAQLASSTLARLSITSNQMIRHSVDAPLILLESGNQFSVFGNQLDGSGGIVGLAVGSGVSNSVIGPNMLSGVILSNSSATTDVWASA
jgi:hypothetical protein